ncbi:pyocin knob domain-containing protein [Candidatus Avoscillospira sp. LCP25S3_F1]|uniref:pyocin knob domain-containing protein n=1 Tax=Candidatus Avoscillospira sp. LCP25S3_F1 TaxID=3438825 RepID=UPI003F927937
MSVKTNELPQAAEIAESDSFVVTTSQGTKRMSLSLLKQVFGKLFAPSGFGLGEDRVREAPLSGNADSISVTGLYLGNDNTPTAKFGNSAIEHISYSPDYAFQIAHLLESTTSFGYGIVKRRSKERGVWRAWEWDNPIMEYGVEYRTTSRYHRKPVYAKLVQFGVLPNATASSVAHRIVDIENIVSVSGSTSDKKNIPTLNYGGGSSMDDVIDVLVDPTNVTIYAARDRSSATANVLIRYTKTADE